MGNESILTALHGNEMKNNEAKVLDCKLSFKLILDAWREEVRDFLASHLLFCRGDRI